MKRFTKISMMLCAALMVSTGIFSQSTDKAGAANTVKVVFTGALHSCADKYPSLTAFIKQERKAAQENGCGVITLDAGDMAFGSIYSAFTFPPTFQVYHAREKKSNFVSFVYNFREI